MDIEILRVVPFEELVWVCRHRFVGSGLFSGEHTFQLVPEENGTKTRARHRCRGPAVGAPHPA